MLLGSYLLIGLAYLLYVRCQRHFTPHRPERVVTVSCSFPYTAFSPASGPPFRARSPSSMATFDGHGRPMAAASSFRTAAGRESELDDDDNDDDNDDGDSDGNNDPYAAPSPIPPTLRSCSCSRATSLSAPALTSTSIDHKFGSDLHASITPCRRINIKAITLFLLLALFLSFVYTQAQLEAAVARHDDLQAQFANFRRAHTEGAEGMWAVLKELAGRVEAVERCGW